MLKSIITAVFLEKICRYFQCLPIPTNIFGSWYFPVSYAPDYGRGSAPSLYTTKKIILKDIVFVSQFLVLE